MLAAAGQLRVGAPIAHPGKVVCIGLNYVDHAQETRAEIPAEPIIFMKDPATVIGPDDEVLIPRRSAATDFEVEWAVVIGSTAVPGEQARTRSACIAGYAIADDVSEREFQLERGGPVGQGEVVRDVQPAGPVARPGRGRRRCAGARTAAPR